MQTYTLTFGNRAENHKGMQIIGNQMACGLSHDDLISIQKGFEDDGYETKLIKLNDLLNTQTKKETNTNNDNTNNDNSNINDATNGDATNGDVTGDATNGVGEIAELLIIINGVERFVNTDTLFEEQKVLEKDTQAYMYGRVVNKKARYNLCFSDFSQKANFDNKKGTVYNFTQVKTLNKLRNEIGKLNPKLNKLHCEGNYYYDIQKTFIGFHGDAEREIVVGCRLGENFPFYYRWYHKNQPRGNLLKIILSHGDMYIMSDKAVGKDWKSSNIYTLRHAAGQENLIGL